MYTCSAPLRPTTSCTDRAARPSPATALRREGSRASQSRKKAGAQKRITHGGLKFVTPPQGSCEIDLFLTVDGNNIAPPRKRNRSGRFRRTWYGATSRPPRLTLRVASWVFPWAGRRAKRDARQERQKRRVLSYEERNIEPGDGKGGGRHARGRTPAPSCMKFVRAVSAAKVGAVVQYFLHQQ